MNDQTKYPLTQCKNPFSPWHLRRDIRRAAQAWDAAEQAVLALASPHPDGEGSRAHRKAVVRARRAIRSYSTVYASALEQCMHACTAITDDNLREKLLAELRSGASARPSESGAFPIAALLPLSAPLERAVRGLTSHNPVLLSQAMPTAGRFLHQIRTEPLPQPDGETRP
jgi:hypothetical protein